MIASCSDFLIGRLDDDNRDFVQTGALRRAPAPLAGDDLESVGHAAHRPYHDRLNDAAFAQRSGKFVKFIVGKHAPRIARIRPQRTGRNSPLSCGRSAELSLPTSPISAARPRPNRDRAASSAIAAFPEIPVTRLAAFTVHGSGAARTRPSADESSFSRWMISVASRR